MINSLGIYNFDTLEATSSTAITTINDAIKRVSGERSKLGCQPKSIRPYN